MGIISLSELIAKSPATATIRLSEFVGRRIAVDATNWIYTTSAPLLRESVFDMQYDPLSPDGNRYDFMRRVMTALGRYLTRMAVAGVLPVFVFDAPLRSRVEGGQSGPTLSDKRSCCEERQGRKAALRARIDSLRRQLLASTPLQRSADDIVSLRKLLANDIAFSEEEFAQIQSAIHNLGFPVRIAPDEAELECVRLTRSRVAIAVWTTDYDALPYGGELVIRRYAQSQSQSQGGVVEVVSLGLALTHLSLSYSAFVDLCIMCGCDYNKRVPGIGPKRALKLIREYGSIDAIIANAPPPKSGNWECLNYLRCRKIFSFPSSPSPQSQSQSPPVWRNLDFSLERLSSSTAQSYLPLGIYTNLLMAGANLVRVEPSPRFRVA
jgi:flap endonuclease-1